MITFDCLPNNDGNHDRVKEYVGPVKDSYCYDTSYYCDYSIITGTKALLDSYIDALKSIAAMVESDNVTITVYNIG